MERLTLSRLFFSVLFRKMASDDATAHRADDGMVARIVSRDAADHRPLDAARRMGRAAHGENEGCGGECGLPESCHADIRLF